MNVHELPMIAFTVLAQMSVGAFVVLGIINVIARLRGASTEVLDEISDPAAYAIGGTLILGLGASMFHMNDPLNVLNVFRHFDSSWLSREIIGGMAFSGIGFVYAACQFFKIGSAGMRQILAGITAIVGIIFVWAMANVYYSLPTVPAWNTWITPARFYTTSLLLGAFAIGAAFMAVVMLRRRAALKGASTKTTEGAAASRRLGRLGGVVRKQIGQERYSPEARAIILASLRGIAIAGVALLGFEFVLQSLHLTDLMQHGAVGIESAHAFSGTLSVLRIVLVSVGAGVMALFLFRTASNPEAPALGVATLVTVAFACVLVAEFLGRAAFYEQMTRIGM